MKRNAPPSTPVSRSRSRRHRYTKVLDNRKHPVRGLWRRNGSFYARITVEDDCGRKSLKWVPLKKATTASETQDELRTILSLVCLRNILKAARTDGYLKASPAAEDHCTERGRATAVDNFNGTGRR